MISFYRNFIRNARCHPGGEGGEGGVTLHKGYGEGVQRCVSYAAFKDGMREVIHCRQMLLTGELIQFFLGRLERIMEYLSGRI